MQAASQFLTLLRAEHSPSPGLFVLLVVERKCEASKQFASVLPLWMHRVWEQLPSRVRWVVKDRATIPKWAAFLEVVSETAPLLFIFPDRPSLWGKASLWRYIRIYSPRDEFQTSTDFIRELKGVNTITRRQLASHRPDLRNASWEYYLELCDSGRAPLPKLHTKK